MITKLSLILILAVAIASCDEFIQDPKDHDQIDLSSVIVSSFISDNYTRDAKLLYCNEIYSDSIHFNRNNPIIDTSEISKILKIIQTVYDLHSQESDIIFNLYKIHSRICIDFNSLYIKVKSDQPEIINLVQGKIPTGSSYLDNLLFKYHFDSVTVSYDYPRFPWMTVYFKKEYNMIPVVKEFARVPSIILTDFESGPCVGDGNTIYLKRGKYSAQIIFSIGDGDCPAGCIYHKFWEFEVADSKAVFTRTWED